MDDVPAEEVEEFNFELLQVIKKINSNLEKMNANLDKINAALECIAQKEKMFK
jgi:hypothetical protein